MDSVHNTVDTFTPAPGYFLVETIQENSQFKPKQAVDDSMTRKGKVLKIGDEYSNEFGTLRKAPPIQVGDLVAYRWEYNNDSLELNFTEYPIVKFDNFRGKL